MFELVAQRGLTRLILGSLLLGGLTVVLGGGCSYRNNCDDDDDVGISDDDDDDDDDRCDDDDDDDVIIVTSSTLGNAAGDPESYVLRDYRIEPSQGEGAHPVRRVADIRGVSLFGILGPGEYGDVEIQSFTERLLQSNDPLLRLPPEAGSLRFEGIRVSSDSMVVSYQQWWPGHEERAEGAMVLFVFDRFGQLRQIENTMQLAVVEHQAKDEGQQEVPGDLPR